MRQAVDEKTFEAERERYQLRFCCEDCTFFVSATESCIHFWPVGDHRRARYAQPGYGEVVFCKEFELR